MNSLIVCGAQPRDEGTRSPIELFWTAKKVQDFCTKMKFPPLYIILGGAGAGQHYLVGFISLLSPQARGASVMSVLFQSVRKGISDKFMAI